MCDRIDSCHAVKIELGYREVVGPVELSHTRAHMLRRDPHDGLVSQKKSAKE